MWAKGFVIVASALTAGLGVLQGPGMPGVGDANEGPDNHQPANKVSVAASSLEVMTAPVMEGAVSEEHDLLGTEFRTSNPADLAIQVTLECALWTDVTVVGNGDSSAVAAVKVWVTLDGERLPVSADEPDDDERGKVVFCNREYRMVISDLDDEDANHTMFLRTRSANAFNWIEIDAGSGVHTLTVTAQLEAQVDGVGTAKAIVGKRTLVVEPLHLTNDATL